MADVQAAIKDWSPTSGANFPQGAATVGQGVDDNFREICGAVTRGLSHKGADIASTTTTDIGAVEGFFHDITGTTTISSFGTVRAGIHKILRFTGAGLIVHSSSLVCPGGGNITRADGDIAEVFSLGSGNWVITSYEYSTNGSVPVGTIFDFGGTTAPSGWLGCDGSAVSRTTYARLFGVIGTTWGAGNGSTTFNLPNFQRRTAVGSGGSGTGTLGSSVGNTGGSETHTLSTAELPSLSGTSLTVGTTDGGGAAGSARFLTGTGVNTSTGAGASNSTASIADSSYSITNGGGAHNNIQPSAVVLKIIKY